MMVAGYFTRQQIVAMGSLRKALSEAMELGPGTLRELARESGVSVGHLSRILSGERNGTPEIAERVGEAFQRWAERSSEAAAIIRRSTKTRRRQ